MELDLETFLITLYVITDDWYQKAILAKLPGVASRRPSHATGNVVPGAAAQWRSGVPWKTERGFVRYASKHLRPFFPGMTSQSAFILLQQRSVTTG